MDPYDLLPPLSREEFAALRADIRANGVLHPVFVDETGAVLDGRHRLKIKPDAPRKVIRGLTQPEKQAFVIRCNFTRRNLSPEQKAETRRKMREIAGSLRGEGWTQTRVASSLGIDRTTVAKWFSNSVNGHTVTDARTVLTRESRQAIVARAAGGETQAQIASDFGVCQKTVSNVVKAASIRDGQAAEFDRLRKREAGEFKGLYDVLVIDPPWPTEKIELDWCPNQVGFNYPTMSVDELRQFKLPVKANSHVWLWATQRFLPVAFQLLDAWGLRYVCTFTWNKGRGFQPVGLPMFNSEFAIYARHGSPRFTTTKAFPTCFTAERGKHSEKPDSFYDMVRRVTSGRRIDIFGRRSIDGFDTWGNEV